MFPSSVKTFPTLIDLADSVLALHQNERGNEITAIESWLLNNAAAGVEWTSCPETWTRTGNHTFTVSGDKAAKYRKGTRVRYKDGGSFDYGVVKSSSYSDPNTTVTLIINTDYEMAAATITDTYISYFEQPDGFPYDFNFSATLSNVTVGNGTLVQKFRAGFGIFIYQVEFEFGSTSAIAGDVAFTPPVTPLNYNVNARNAFGGNTNCHDANVTLNYSGNIIYDPNGKLSARFYSVSGSLIVPTPLSLSAPFTWATGDVLTMNEAFKW